MPLLKKYPKNRILTLFFLSIYIVSLSYSPEEKLLTNLSGPYLGQVPPGTTPRMFAPGIISNSDTLDYGCAFSPDGSEFYFSRGGGTAWSGWPQILCMKMENGVWTDPEETTFSDPAHEYLNMEPFISYDDKRLYFCSTRPLFDDDLGHIWVVDRTNSGWSEPDSIGEPIDSHTSMFLTISESGATYYTGPNTDIYFCTLKNGVFSTPTRVGSGISTENYEAHPFIARDESYLIFDSRRPGGSGETDIYVSFRKGGNTWTEPVNLGSTINSSEADMTAYVSPDGKYLFYCSLRSGYGDVYWVDAKVIRALEPVDLAATAFKIKPKKPISRGGTIKLVGKVINSSEVYSSATEVSFYLSLKNKISKKSILLGTTTVESLQPGKSRKIKLNSSIPENLKPKGYYVIAAIDPDDLNADPDRENNIVISKNKIAIY